MAGTPLQSNSGEHRRHATEPERLLMTIARTLLAVRRLLVYERLSTQDHLIWLYTSAYVGGRPGQYELLPSIAEFLLEQVAAEERPKQDHKNAEKVPQQTVAEATTRPAASIFAVMPPSTVEKRLFSETDMKDDDKPTCKRSS
ncbi:hypothetical protein BDF19DRAFT_415615 [Syncephalis fuscata]|nr:hypothetical protein BDF19DRAFT_415615 [Syncephalis fuscata]